MDFKGLSCRDAGSKDPRVAGVRAFLEKLAGDPRLRAVATQTVGAKGHGGVCGGRGRAR